jgi:hypothetical protein
MKHLQAQAYKESRDAIKSEPQYLRSQNQNKNNCCPVIRTPGCPQESWSVQIAAMDESCK